MFSIFFLQKRTQRTNALESSTSFHDKESIKEILINDFMSSEESGSESERLSDSESDTEEAPALFI